VEIRRNQDYCLHQNKKKEPYKFTSDTARLTRLINQNNTASDSIGIASFKNAVKKRIPAYPGKPGCNILLNAARQEKFSHATRWKLERSKYGFGR